MQRLILVSEVAATITVGLLLYRYAKYWRLIRKVKRAKLKAPNIADRYEIRVWDSRGNLQQKHSMNDLKLAKEVYASNSLILGSGLKVIEFWEHDSHQSVQRARRTYTF